MDVETNFERDFPPPQSNQRSAEEDAGGQFDWAKPRRTAPPRTAPPQEQEDDWLEPERRLAATPRYAMAKHMERDSGIAWRGAPAFL